MNAEAHHNATREAQPPAGLAHGFGIEAKQLMLCYLFENYPLLACGMAYIGRTRGVHYMDGHFWDKLYYQVTRSEWEQQGYWCGVTRGA